MAAVTEDVGARRRLGRGLSAMLGDVAPTMRNHERGAGPGPVAVEVHDGGSEGLTARAGERHEGGRVVMVPVGAIVASPYQPRRKFAERELSELAASIKQAGVVQPVVVRRAAGQSTGGQAASGTGTNGTQSTLRYELVAGERRWRAAKLAGLPAVPAVVAELTDEKAAEWSLIENLQRADLTAMERAHALKSLCVKFGLSHAELAAKVGLERSSVANMIRLTELEEPIQMMIESGELTAGHGRALLAMPESVDRAAMAARCVLDGGSVRRVEEAVAAWVSAEAARAEGKGGDSADPAAAAARAAHDLAKADLEAQLAAHLGTDVKIKTERSGKRGTLTVKFYDLDQFDGLMTKMGFVMR